MTPQQNTPQPEPPKRIFPNWIWWLVFLGLLIWNIFSLWPAPVPEVTIPYTTFVDQVKAGNVSSVKITGD